MSCLSWNTAYSVRDTLYFGENSFSIEAESAQIKRRHWEEKGRSATRRHMLTLMLFSGSFWVFFFLVKAVVLIFLPRLRKPENEGKKTVMIIFI